MRKKGAGGSERGGKGGEKIKPKKRLNGRTSSRRRGKKEMGT